MLLVPAAQRFDILLCATGIGPTTAQAGLEESAGDAAQPIKGRVGEPLRPEGGSQECDEFVDAFADGIDA